jgi:predicted dehydrogenase
LRDTALVSMRFDNGAMATAEANFHAVYGYDVRGAVFGSGGMVKMGDVRRSTFDVRRSTFEHDAVRCRWRVQCHHPPEH